MSMKKSLLDEAESPSRELTAIHFEEATEATGLSPNKYENDAERTFFHTLPTEVVKTSRG